MIVFAPLSADPTVKPPWTALAVLGAGCAVALYLVGRNEMRPNRISRIVQYFKAPQRTQAARVGLAGTEREQRNLLKAAMYLKEDTSVPMDERIAMWNHTLRSSYEDGRIAIQTLNAWRDKLPV